MLSRLLALVAVAVVALAGCVTPPTPIDAASLTGDALEASRLPPPDVDLSTAIVSDHGAPYMHAVQSLHSGSYRMELVGYNPLSRVGEVDPVVANSAFGAVTIRGHVACVAGFAGTGGAGGAILVDIEDPTNPTVLSSIPTTFPVARCLMTDDGQFLLVGSYGGANPGLPLPDPLGSVGTYGVSVYDVSDPKTPKFLFHDTAGARLGNPGNVAGGPYHNVDTVNVNGTNYIFQTYTGTILKINADASALEIVGELEHADHDFWLGNHPITGGLLLATGAGDGTAFFDVNDPENPVLLSVWEANDSYVGWHRQWLVDGLVDGRALMVVAGEECGNGKSLPYTVLDITDPSTPIELGHWQIPGAPEIKEPGQLCSMNAHEFTTYKGYVATGNYHAGVWVFDAGTPARALEPVTIGYYEPHEDPRAHGGTRNTPFAWSPDVWGAYFDDRGYVIAADWATGLYVLSVPGLTEGA